MYHLINSVKSTSWQHYSPTILGKGSRSRGTSGSVIGGCTITSGVFHKHVALTGWPTIHQLNWYGTGWYTPHVKEFPNLQPEHNPLAIKLLRRISYTNHDNMPTTLLDEGKAIAKMDFITNEIINSRCHIMPITIHPRIRQSWTFW